ncbi:MAG: pilus assembly protein PilM [Deltaproteobacteria bacterium]|nr:pilus assembly protein PilM [Deltaproteobacteria bacterium]
MPGKILGIDINTDSVAAVQAEGGLRGYNITDWSCVMIEEAGGMEEALRVLSEQMELRADTCISAIAGEQASYRNLQMPFRDTKKIRQTIAFNIETMVPFPIQSLLVDFTIVNQSDQSEILAASVRRTYISEYLTLLQGHGIDPDVLDIRGVPTGLWLLNQPGIPDDGLLLEMGRKQTVVLLYLNKRISLIRVLPFADDFSSGALPNAPTDNHHETQVAEHIEPHFRTFCANVHHTLHGFECHNNRTIRPEMIFITGSGSRYPDTERFLEEFLDIPVERINVARDTRVRMDEDVAQLWEPAVMDGALALALRDTKKGMGFNFRTEEFEIMKRTFRLRKEIQRVAVFLIVILALAIAYFGVDYYLLKKQYRMLDKQITGIYRQTFPDEKRIVDPVQQMKVKIAELKSSAFSLPGMRGDQRVIDLLRDISLKIPRSLDVTVSTMVVDPEAVKIKGDTDTFNTVDIVKRRLEPSEYFSEVTISSANLDRSGKRVQFEIKLQRKK